LALDRVQQRLNLILVNRLGLSGAVHRSEGGWHYGVTIPEVAVGVRTKVTVDELVLRRRLHRLQLELRGRVHHLLERDLRALRNELTVVPVVKSGRRLETWLREVAVAT
jgi:hypothetical protein